VSRSVLRRAVVAFAASLAAALPAMRVDVVRVIAAE